MKLKSSNKLKALSCPPLFLIGNTIYFVHTYKKIINTGKVYKLHEDGERYIVSWDDGPDSTEWLSEGAMSEYNLYWDIDAARAVLHT